MRSLRPPIERTAGSEARADAGGPRPVIRRHAKGGGRIVSCRQGRERSPQELGQLIWDGPTSLDAASRTDASRTDHRKVDVIAVAREPRRHIRRVRKARQRGIHVVTWERRGTDAREYNRQQATAEGIATTLTTRRRVGDGKGESRSSPGSSAAPQNEWIRSSRSGWREVPD